MLLLIYLASWHHMEKEEGGTRSLPGWQWFQLQASSTLCPNQAIDKQYKLSKRKQ